MSVAVSRRPTVGTSSKPGLYACSNRKFSYPDKLPKEFMSAISHTCVQTSHLRVWTGCILKNQRAFFRPFLSFLSLSESLTRLLSYLS
jgi:hypothetical protein